MAGTRLIPLMTSNTAPLGVASSSSNTVADGFFYAYRAMDRDTNRGWATTNNAASWIQYEFDTTGLAGSYTLSVQSTNTTQMPKDFTLDASNTGAFTGEEVTLDTQTGVTSWTASETKTFTFTNAVAYKYYRLNVSAFNGSSWGYLEELALYSPIITEASLTGVVTITAAVETANASLTASTTIVAKNKALNKASSVGSVVILAEAIRRKHDYGFQLVQEIQIASIIKTFHFVQELEQTPSATIIERINI